MVERQIHRWREKDINRQVNRKRKTERTDRKDNCIEKGEGRKTNRDRERERETIRQRGRH